MKEKHCKSRKHKDNLEILKRLMKQHDDELLTKDENVDKTQSNNATKENDIKEGNVKLNEENYVKEDNINISNTDD